MKTQSGIFKLVSLLLICFGAAFLTACSPKKQSDENLTGSISATILFAAETQEIIFQLMRLDILASYAKSQHYSITRLDFQTLEHANQKLQKSHNVLEVILTLGGMNCTIDYERFIDSHNEYLGSAFLLENKYPYELEPDRLPYFTDLRGKISEYKAFVNGMIEKCMFSDTRLSAEEQAKLNIILDITSLAETMSNRLSAYLSTTSTRPFTPWTSELMDKRLSIEKKIGELVNTASSRTTPIQFDRFDARLIELLTSSYIYIDVDGVISISEKPQDESKLFIHTWMYQDDRFFREFRETILGVLYDIDYGCEACPHNSTIYYYNHVAPFGIPNGIKGE